MTIDTRSAATQWEKTHRRYHCPRKTKVPSWDPYGGARVVATEKDVRHARRERPMGDILIAEGDTLWANPDTPEIRRLLSAGRIVEVPGGAPAPDPARVAGDGVETVLDNGRLAGTLKGNHIDTADQLAQAWLDGSLKQIRGLGRGGLREIGESLVTAGLIAVEDLGG